MKKALIILAMFAALQSCKKDNVGPRLPNGVWISPGGDLQFTMPMDHPIVKVYQDGNLIYLIHGAEKAVDVFSLVSVSGASAVIRTAQGVEITIVKFK